MKNDLQTAPGYRSFNLPDQIAAPTLLRPRTLCRIAICEHFLGCDQEGVIARIEDGRLAWAFQLNPLDSYCRDLRVLTLSLIELLGLKTGLPKRTADLTFDEVVAIIMPHQRPTLRGTELQRVFSTFPDTIRKIRQRGGFIVTERAKQRYGPNASHKYSRGSVINFLRRGRIA